MSKPTRTLPARQASAGFFGAIKSSPRVGLHGGLGVYSDSLPMRILFPIHVWHPEARGGTEVHARAVAKALTAAGHQVGVFARTGRPGRPEYEVTTEWDGPVSVTRINNTWRDNLDFEWMYKNRRIHEAFARELDEFKPDLVHVHHLTGLSSTILEEVKLRKLPLVFTLHDFWTVCPRGQRITRDLEICSRVDRTRCWKCLGGMWPHIFGPTSTDPLIVDRRGDLSPTTLAEWDRHMAYVLGLCDRLITPSEFHRERMLDLRIDPARLVSLPHGLSEEGLTRGPRESRPIRKIGYIGSVIPTKGAHILLKAFRLLEGEDLELHIHGEISAHHEDASYGNRLRQIAGNAPNIHFHGGYDPSEVGDILAGLDLLVVPALWWETFCLTVREGLLSGLPVIASDLGAVREALDGETDGLLFEPGNAKDLARQITRVVTDPDLAQKLRDRGASVKRLTQYLPELLSHYEAARRAATERADTLVVAPPSFPDDPRAARPLPFDRVGVQVSQQGPAAVAVSTRPPTGSEPSVGLTLKIAEGARSLGTIQVEVDLRAIAAAAASQAPAAPKVDSAYPDPDGEADPSTNPSRLSSPGNGERRARLPQGIGRTNLSALGSAKRLVPRGDGGRREALAAPDLRSQSWQPGRVVRTKTTEVTRHDPTASE